MFNVLLTNILYIRNKYIKQLFTTTPNIDYIRLIIRYIFYILISIIIILYIWIKLRFQFWSRQPVFHIYNIYYWLFYQGIIQKELPEKNKFYAYNYQTDNYIPKDSLVEFIGKHFLNRKDIVYKPTIEAMTLLFKQSIQPLITTYYKDNQLVGCITARRLTISLNNYTCPTRIVLPCYYIDFLCVHKDYRKQNIAPCLIQTHEYNQREKTKIQVSLFKREGKLNVIVPLVLYKTYGYVIYKWKQEVNTLSISAQQLIYIFSRLNHLVCKIIPNLSTLIDLVKSKLLTLRIVGNINNVAALYIFRDTQTNYRKKQCVECLGSYNFTLSNDIFLKGFTSCLSQLPYKFVFIENLGDNNIINQLLGHKQSPSTICPMAYYLYNYVYKPIKTNDVLIIA